MKITIVLAAAAILLILLILIEKIRETPVGPFLIKCPNKEVFSNVTRNLHVEGIFWLYKENNIIRIPTARKGQLSRIKLICNEHQVNLTSKSS